jgi:uncharacterized DUF497 family protein
MGFEWDEQKSRANFDKHGIDFETAQYAFLDSKRIVAQDLTRSQNEKRYFLFGKVKGGVLTVRFTYRAHSIRIIGAGYWRKGKVIYEKHNKIHK